MRLLRRFLRAGAFVTKEIAEVRRQPRLILSLIFGPFLILLLFGVGYVGESGHLNAIVLIPPTGGYSSDPATYRKMFGGQVNIAEVTSDRGEALDRLDRRDVDVVIQVPQDSAQQIESGAQAKFPVYFNEVDPLRRDYITYLVYLYTNELNKQTLAAAASQGQQSAGDLHSIIARMRNSLTIIENSMARGDTATARGQMSSVQGSSVGAQMGLLLIGQVLGSGSPMINPTPAPDSPKVNLDQGTSVTTRLNVDVQTLSDDLASPRPDNTKVRSDVARVRADLDQLDSLSRQFQKINPLVLAAPFYAVAQNVAPVAPSFTSFYSPGVLVLLLQHIAVTLAALSVVRERLLGTVELFRVSPISPGEILAGKYASFMIFLGVVAAVLLLLMSNPFQVAGVRLSLGVPILGSWGALILTLALVIFASVGLGFFIASISRSESQAVQWGMLVLLASVFFSGFFLRLEVFWWPIQALSYFLPVTYGVAALQVIMLRGGTPSPVLLVALLMLGTLFMLLGWLLFSREMRKG